MHLHHVKLMLWRNFTARKHQPFSAVCEFITPILLVLVLSLLCHQYIGQSYNSLQRMNNKAAIPKTDPPERLSPLVNGSMGATFLVPEVPREAGVASLIQDFADLTFQAFGHTKQAPQMYPQFYTAVPTLAGMGYRMSNVSGKCPEEGTGYCYKLPGLGSEFRLALVSGGAGMDAVITDFNKPVL